MLRVVTHTRSSFLSSAVGEFEQKAQADLWLSDSSIDFYSNCVDDILKLCFDSLPTCFNCNHLIAIMCGVGRSKTLL